MVCLETADYMDSSFSGDLFIPSSAFFLPSQSSSPFVSSSCPQSLVTTSAPSHGVIKRQEPPLDPPPMLFPSPPYTTKKVVVTPSSSSTTTTTSTTSSSLPEEEPPITPPLTPSTCSSKSSNNSSLPSPSSSWIRLSLSSPTLPWEGRRLTNPPVVSPLCLRRSHSYTCSFRSPGTTSTTTTTTTRTTKTCASDTTTTTNNKNKRRCIFSSSVWQQTNSSSSSRSLGSGSESPSNNTNHTKMLPPLPPRHDAATTITYREIRKLVQPPPHRCMNKPHFRAVTEEPSITPAPPHHHQQQQHAEEEPHSQQSQQESRINGPPRSLASSILPDLPYPMRRFFQHGPRRTQLGGVYPMVSPTSILRKSSYGTPPPIPQKRRLEFESSTTPNSSFSGSSCCSSDTNNKDASSITSFNMVDTVRLAEVKEGDRHKLVHMETTSTSSSLGRRSLPEEEEEDERNCMKQENELQADAQSPSSPQEEQGSNHKRVHFDPRVTVTEFEDNCPRYWFSAFELERLQKESVHLVQRYLLAHPSMISEYNQPRLDPVTGTYRKRALFSIPILRANSQKEEEKMLRVGDKKRPCAESMAKSQVKQILIAARNHLVSDLLSRSLKTIFPHASILAVTTGEEALRVYSDRVSRINSKDHAGVINGFDLVIADGPLNRSLVHGPATVSLDRLEHGNLNSSDRNKSSSITSKASSLMDLRTMASRDKSSSSSSSSLPPSCGAELFRCIGEITHAADAATNNKEANSKSKACQLPLLIGLTASSPKEPEGKAMTENGAGIVWALPPPKMDERLRDEIVSKLLQKRQSKR